MSPKVTWRIIRKCAFFNTTKRKCYLFLNEKSEIASYKGDNLLNKRLLTSVDTRTNLLLYGMIARTKCYVFTVIFPAVFPLEPTFWPAQFMFCIYGFRNRNRTAQRNNLVGECCGEYFQWKQHENDVTFFFGYYYTVTFLLYVISFDWRLP